MVFLASPSPPAVPRVNPTPALGLALAAATVGVDRRVNPTLTQAGVVGALAAAAAEGVEAGEEEAMAVVREPEDEAEEEAAAAAFALEVKALALTVAAAWVAVTSEAEV